jgi:hypothetical protein
VNPLAIELLAADLLRDHQADARRAALAAELPAHATGDNRAVASIRHALAHGLRLLAARLDPSLGAASSSRLAPARH